MKEKEILRIVELVKEEVKRQTNKTPFLIPFDCPICKRETLSRKKCNFEYASNNTWSTIEYTGPKEMLYKIGDNTILKDDIYCYGCGKYFTKTENTNWLEDKK